MPIVEVDTGHTTKPWVLTIHKTSIRDGRAINSRETRRFETEEQARDEAQQFKVQPSCYLIELYVDAGCLHATG